MSRHQILDKIAVLGLGLIGGSVGLAAKQCRSVRNVCGYSRRLSTRLHAKRMGVVDCIAATPEEAVDEADLVIVCAPVAAIVGLIKQCAGALKKGAVVTDVGSTKASIAQEAHLALQGTGALFVGSHPIAGGELHGVAAARADLFDNAMVILTPTEATQPFAVRVVAQFWKSVGARVLMVPPNSHDRIVARTSHLPHVAACALALCAARNGDDIGKFCGPGFADTTRVAASGAEIWRDILDTNRKAIDAELKAFVLILEKFRQNIVSRDTRRLAQMLDRAKACRNRLLRKSGGNGNER